MVVEYIQHEGAYETVRILEEVVQRCSANKVLLEISQNSQENTRVRVSFFKELQAMPATLLKKRLWHRCFPVNFVTFLRTLFSQNTSGCCCLASSRKEISNNYKPFFNRIDFVVIPPDIISLLNISLIFFWEFLDFHDS